MCYIFFLFLTWFTLKRIFWTVVLFSLGKKYERKCFTYLIVFLLTKFIIRDIVIHLMFLYRVLKWDSAHHRKCIAPISHLGLCPQIYVWEGTGNRKSLADPSWRTGPRCLRTKDASFLPRSFNSWNQTSPCLSSQESRDPTEERAGI